MGIITELLELIANTDPTLWRVRLKRHRRHVPLVSTTSANIVRQQQSPRRSQRPVPLRDPQLRDLVTDPISLLAYDAFILDPGKEKNDLPRTETPGVESC